MKISQLGAKDCVTASRDNPVLPQLFCGPLIRCRKNLDALSMVKIESYMESP
jgi:hypothetical protein